MAMRTWPRSWISCNVVAVAAPAPSPRLRAAVAVAAEIIVSVLAFMLLPVLLAQRSGRPVAIAPAATGKQNAVKRVCAGRSLVMIGIVSGKIIPQIIVSTQINWALIIRAAGRESNRTVVESKSGGVPKFPVVALSHYVQPILCILFLLFCFSKAAGGGREALYTVKNQIPKKPPA